MRAVLALSLLGGVLVLVPAQAQQVTPCDMEGGAPETSVSKKPRYGVLPQEIVHLASRRDGVTIEIGLVRPKVPARTRVPVILDASPYYHAMSTLDLRACRPALTENFVPQGFAVALLAVRGTGDSGGCMDLMGPGERADIDQAVTWLGTQPWSNGNIGMIGKSYDGATAWEAASFGNKHLKTIVPVESVSDLYSLMYGHGTPDWRSPAVLSGIYYAESVVFYAPGRDPVHTAEVTACPDYATGLAASVGSAVTRDHDPFGYWAARRYSDRILKNYRGSVLLVHGLQDWNVNPGLLYPWIAELERRGLTVKHLLGQWGHSYPDEAGGDSHRADWPDMLLAWFDKYLRGAKVSTGAKAEVQDSTGRWRTDTAWPPRGVPRTYWLTSTGGLAGKPSSATATALLAADPAHLKLSDLFSLEEVVPQDFCLQPVCASFATDAFAKEFRFAGRPQLTLAVTPTGPAGVISAYLFADAGGTLTRLGWGNVDLQRPGGEGAPISITPGTAYTATLSLQPLDAVVPAGARLLLVLSQGTTGCRVRRCRSSSRPAGPSATCA